MKLLIYSDLHLEFSDFTPPEADFDGVILAGDIDLDANGVEWARKTFPAVPVIYICGNHEFYRHEIGAVQERIRAAAAGTNIHFCENETVRIGNTRFVCATLWTDFCISGSKRDNMIDAAECMSDYHVISLGDRSLEPEDTERFHHESRRFLERELSQTDASINHTVVVTHHAPSAQSLRYERLDADAGPAYASALEPLMLAHAPDLWVHGHTHESVDYRVGQTRVFSNPRGYAFYTNEHGNKNFEPAGVIEL